MSLLSKIGEKADTRRFRVALGLGVLVFVVVGYGLLLFKVPQQVFATKGDTVSAQFRDAALLRSGNDVRVRGVRVGRVQKVSLDKGGRSATARLTIYKDALPIYADARASVRWRTLLGGTFYVDLERGTPAAGELESGEIPINRTQTQVELEDVTNVVRGDARRGTRTILRESPKALADPAQPAGALDALAEASPGIRRGFKAVRGQKPGDLQRLVERTSEAAAALNEPQDALRGLISGSGTTFGVTAARSEQLRSAIAEAASVQAPTRTTLARLNGTLGRADTVVGRLEKSGPDLKPTVDKLRPVVDDASRLLADLRPTARALRPAASSLRTAAEAGDPLLAELDPTLRRLSDKVFPILAKRSPESGRKTYEMIGPALAGATSALSRFDGESYFGALFAQVTDRSVDTLPCRGYVADPTDPRLLDCEALTRLLPNILDPKAKR